MTEPFGQKLKTLRKRKNMSQKEFAKFFGLAESTISMYERDERRPDFDLLNKFADYFEVSTDYLLGRTDSSTITQQEKDEATFQAFINDPELGVWYKELPQSGEEELRKLRTIWEMINGQQK
ncbi:helix-turn-helix domain-containing protein [Lysinibacillus sphaericus]|uniref:helix-turn-helix domain-containing protein n=1 Tax=Lysinibacillus sphaericus TaxID=1421 RepID=UPI003D7FACC7